MLTTARKATLTIATVAAAVVLVPGPARAAGNANLPASATLKFAEEILQAQHLSRGQGVTVAIVSTGVDPRASALSGRVTTGANYTYRRRSSSTPSYGTLVATLIAGGGGSRTFQGMAPMARILSVRTSPDFHEAGASAFYARANLNLLNAKGIRYAASHGAQVIFVTTDVPQGSDADAVPQLVAAVNYAASRNAVVVGTDEMFDRQYGYPAGLPGVIGVAAVTLRGLAAPFGKDQSARNNSILIAAPGNSIGVTSGWEIDGPGAAAAWVTGTVALIKSLYPHLSPAMVQRALANSAKDRPRGGYSTTIGFGLVDPHGALVTASQLAKVTTTAQPGPDVIGAGGYFGAGPVTGAISAVHHSGILLAAYGAAILVGLAMLISMFVLARRQRHADRRRNLAIR